MRFVIFGAGAVGGVVGGRLAIHGHAVTFIARGEHGRVVAESGLVVESPGGTESVRVPVATTAAAVDWGRADVVLLAMKSQDTAAALTDLARTTPPATPVLCLQNGVANERAALRRFETVYGVCVMLPAAHLVPGRVQAYSHPVAGMLDIGRYPGGDDGRCGEIAAALSDSTFESVVRPDIIRWKYRKLIMNLANAIEALCGPAAVGGELGRMVRAEGEEVLGAAGVDVASAEEDRTRRGSTLRLGDIDGSPRGGGSTWQSLARGTGAVEADYLNGEIALLGRIHGRATPVNATLQRLANEMAWGRFPPGSLDEEHVLDAIARSAAV